MRSQITWVLVGCMLLGPSMLADTRELPSVRPSLPSVRRRPSSTRWRRRSAPRAATSARRQTSPRQRSTSGGGALKALRGRLDAMPRAKWSVTDQVDWYLLLAEMNQADFDMRVLRPWARDPGFYISLVAGRLGDTEKLTAEQAARLTKRLRGAPLLLEQARNSADRRHALACRGRHCTTSKRRRMRRRYRCATWAR